MRIAAYTYEADIHCPSCALAAQEGGRLTQAGRPIRDQHGIMEWLNDREGNMVCPVFANEIETPTHCGTCREEIQ